jgi:hypothetical protein
VEAIARVAAADEDVVMFLLFFLDFFFLYSILILEFSIFALTKSLVVHI